MGDSLPPLVRRALAAADRIGLATSREVAAPGASSCSLPDTGRILAMLAAGCVGGRILEIGTGAGVGTAWMVSAMPASARLVTVERDPERARAAREVFAGDPRVDVVEGDAHEVVPPRAPFDLLFSDGGWRRLDDLVDLVEVGGRIVVDDLTPLAALPADSSFREHDPKRQFFQENPRLVSAELVLPDLANAVLVGTRVL